MDTLTLIAIAAGIFSVVILVVVGIVTKKRATGAGLGERDTVIQEIRSLEGDLQKSVKKYEKYASLLQLETVREQISTLENQIENEKRQLKEFEEKLETAQKAVEEKEQHHQETKSAKAEDEAKLAELLASFENISHESVALEQNLAASLKELDSIMTELELTQEQKAMFQELSDTLVAAGSRLRDLIMEYDSVQKRLQALAQQHQDLEDEYTKLVEKQLGG